jgi:uncharacterized coiled-coil protein SlyX
MATLKLQSRLEQLEQHIQGAEARLKLKNLYAAHHQVKAAELRARYKALTEKLHAEIANEEAHGHHVSDLELSVRKWLDGLEINMG